MSAHERLGYLRHVAGLGRESVEILGRAIRQSMGDQGETSGQQE